MYWHFCCGLSTCGDGWCRLLGFFVGAWDLESIGGRGIQSWQHSLFAWGFIFGCWLKAWWFRIGTVSWLQWSPNMFLLVAGCCYVWVISGGQVLSNDEESLSHWMLFLSPKSSNWYNESVSTYVEHSHPLIPSFCSNNYSIPSACSNTKQFSSCCFFPLPPFLVVLL